MKDASNTYFEIQNEIIRISDQMSFSEDDYIDRYGTIASDEDRMGMQFYLYQNYIDLPYQFRLLYFKILYFLEAERQVSLKEYFIKNFQNKMFSEAEIRKKATHPEYDITINPLISDVYEMFSSIEMFYGEAPPEITSLLQKKLETALRSLSFSLKDKSITKEKELYNAVEIIIRTFFPDSENLPYIQFVKKMKSYIPDLFVPECAAVIELKFVDTVERFKSCIESIDTDIIGYTDNPKYKRFFAVLYCSERFYSEPEIEILWRERKYPTNWSYVIVTP